MKEESSEYACVCVWWCEVEVEVEVRSLHLYYMYDERDSCKVGVWFSSNNQEHSEKKSVEVYSVYVQEMKKENEHKNKNMFTYLSTAPFSVVILLPIF